MQPKLSIVICSIYIINKYKGVDHSRVVREHGHQGEDSPHMISQYQNIRCMKCVNRMQQGVLKQFSSIKV